MTEAYLLPGLLLAVLGLPLLSALVVCWIGRGQCPERTRRCAAWLAATHLILTAVFVVIAVGTVRSPGNSGFAPFEPFGVPGDPGLEQGVSTSTTSWNLLPLAYPGNRGESAVQFFLGVDGLNLPLLALASLIVFLAVLVSWESVDNRAHAFYGWLFLLQTACLGAFLSFDLLLFYVFFELTLIPAFFLIGSWGVGGGRRDAARKFFLYTLLGSLLTLVGILGVVIENPTPIHPMTGDRIGSGSTSFPRAGTVTFSIPELMRNVHVWDEAHANAVRRTQGDPIQHEIAQQAQRQRRTLAAWLFFALMAGFAVKVPIVPFHTWLPSAYSEAPMSVVMVLSAIMAKLGTFGILRIVLPLTPEPSVLYGLTIFGTLGAVGIVYAAFCAFAQKDIKLLAAYSSVSHLGFLVLALFALTPESIAGASLHMINHGLTAAALFALLAGLHDRYRTLDSTQYGGLMARFPRYSFFFMVVALAGVGLPGLCNFVSEMLMLAGLFAPQNLKAAGFGLAACAAAGIFLSAWYMFTLVRRVFFGPMKEPASGALSHDLNGREWTTFSLLGFLILALGLVPQPILGVMSADVQRIAMTVDAARERLP